LNGNITTAVSMLLHQLTHLTTISVHRLRDVQCKFNVEIFSSSAYIVYDQQLL